MEQLDLVIQLLLRYELLVYIFTALSIFVLLLRATDLFTTVNLILLGITYALLIVTVLLNGLLKGF